MKREQWTPTRILAAGFAGIILIGAVLLALPVSSRSGESIPLLNAIFTSTSATCVTGLVVYDTWTQFSFFGQAVLLILIQVGGLGFITAVIAIFMLTNRRIGLRQRLLLAESVGDGQLSGVVRMSRRILSGTALFEGCGAALLASRFVPEFGWGRGLWFSLFHSVSAFCNAGFDLMGVLSPYSSLTRFDDDPVVVLTIALLIILGGVGFIVWNDLVEAHRERRALQLHTLVTLLATAVLLAAGTLAMLLFEWNGTLSGMSFGKKLLNAFFHAVTPRTAGFNTVDIAAMTDAGKALTVLLMFIGAAPGGTGGGVKVTTFAVVLLSACASLAGREDTSVGRRRLEEKLVRGAFCSMSVYLGMTTLGILVLCSQSVRFADAVFECFSAIGTVGLSVGITASLNVVSKIVLILLMYAGRVGSLTVFLAMRRRSGSFKLKNPIGKVIVG